MITIHITIYENEDGRISINTEPFADYPTGLEEATWDELEPKLQRLLAVKK